MLGENPVERNVILFCVITASRLRNGVAATIRAAA
jgi:hypothetical protein